MAGIFCLAKDSFFSRSVTSRNENWTHIFRQNGRVLSVIRKNGIKTDEIQSITKKKHTKLWPDEIYPLYSNEYYYLRVRLVSTQKPCATCMYVACIFTKV